MQAFLAAGGTKLMRGRNLAVSLNPAISTLSVSQALDIAPFTAIWESAEPCAVLEEAAQRYGIDHGDPGGRPPHQETGSG